MSYTNKPFEALNLIDDYLMNAVSSDPEVGKTFCRTILSVMLQKEIGEIRVATQRIILPGSPDHRGIRMDVEVEEDMEGAGVFPAMTIYDVEPHRIPVRETEASWRKRDPLPRRNRFYQAKIDSRHMQSGERNFRKLPNLYIINVLDYDPFGFDQMVYTIANRCKEVPELECDDGLQFLYFNATGTRGGSGELCNLLNFILHSNAEHAIDETTRELYDHVSRVKVQPEVRESYMRLDEIIEIAQEEAVAEATEELRRQLEAAKQQAEEATEAAQQQAKEAAEAAQQRVKEVTEAAREQVRISSEESTRKTMQDTIIDLLGELGDVSTEVEAKIRSQEDLTVLKKWLKLSARVEDIEAFEKML